MHYFNRTKKILIGLLYIAVFSYILSGCASQFTILDKNCIVHRAAFDIGSETTKMKVGKVDKCLQKNLAIIYQYEVKVPYAENKPEGFLTGEIRQKGIGVLQELKKEALNHGAQAFAGVATEAFRQASNTPEFLQDIKEKTGISVEAISQDKEAILGYLAAVSAAGLHPENTVVWDIGGSSMQIIMRRPDQTFIIYRGKMASVSFKERILTQIQQRHSPLKISPNPIGEENLLPAIKIARGVAADIPEEIRNAINKPDAVILGIGGVHNESIRKQLQVKEGYSKEELINTLQSGIKMSDMEIGGRYAETAISNLILVLGFMEQLGINTVNLVNVNLADGVLTAPAFW